MAICYWHGTTRHNVSITSRRPDHLPDWYQPGRKPDHLPAWYQPGFVSVTTVAWCGAVYRIVCHTIAGVGFTAIVATTALAGLGTPSSQGLAVAEPVLAAPASASASLAPGTARDLTAAAARAERMRAARSEERAISKAARQASRRSKTLAEQGESIAAEDARLKAAAEKAALQF